MMAAAMADAKPLVDRFLAILDEEILLQQDAVGHLKGLADALLARDPAAAERLLQQAAETQTRFQAAETRRLAACDALARALGRPRRDITLARLAREVPGSDGLALGDRHAKIQALVGDVRRQHLRTAAILLECARLNRALLLGLFPAMESARTYGAGGVGERPASGLLDARS